MSNMYELKGCGNHACRISPPRGMGTNGPCSCIRDTVKIQKVLHNYKQLQREIVELNEVNAQLMERVEELEREAKTGNGSQIERGGE